MICPKCKLQLRIKGVKNKGENRIKEYVCVNKQCPDYNKGIEKEIISTPAD